MRTTIDGAGRVVVPKSFRDTMGLSAGEEIDVVLVEGRIEIEVAPADVTLEQGGTLPRIVTRGELPALTDEMIRDTVDSTRR